jgi:hypothetical protein
VPSYAAAQTPRLQLYGGDLKPFAPHFAPFLSIEFFYLFNNQHGEKITSVGSLGKIL